VTSHANGKFAPAYILDSFAMLCYLAEEPGFRQVTELFIAVQATKTDVFLSMINLGEILYITEREYGLRRAQAVLATIEQLPINLVDATRPRILAAAHLKANYPISYADAFAAAAAQEFAATVLTGDPEFARVEHLVAIQWLPQR
jgi:predicted nucleic acid-binding protein